MARFSPNSDQDLDSIPVPEDVAAAVRRAIEAIETVMQEPRGSETVTFGPLHVTSPGQPTAAMMAAVAEAAVLATPEVSTQPYAAAQLNGSHNATDSETTAATGEQAAQPGARFEPLLSFGELSSDGAVYPLPVLPPLTSRGGNKPPPSEQRRGALRRLIAGVRRR